jgi:hypothetical protein
MVRRHVQGGVPLSDAATAARVSIPMLAILADAWCCCWSGGDARAGREHPAAREAGCPATLPGSNRASENTRAARLSAARLISVSRVGPSCQDTRHVGRSHSTETLTCAGVSCMRRVTGFHPVPGSGMPRRTIDIAFTKRRVAVFVDGCFWHGCRSLPVVIKAGGRVPPGGRVHRQRTARMGR